MTQDQDIDLMLADSGDTFTSAGVTQPCQATLQDEIVGGDAQYPGQVMAMGFVLVRASAFPSLATDDVVTVQLSGASTGIDYRAARLLRIQDGRMLQVFLGTSDFS